MVEPRKAKKIVPRVLVIRGEPSRVRRLGDLAILDLLESILPLSVLVQSVLVVWLARLPSVCAGGAFFLFFGLIRRTQSTYHKMHPII